MSTIVIKGPFTPDEVRRITAILQDIESMRPGENFEVYVDASEMEGEVEAIRAAMIPPPLPGSTRTTRRWARKTYRGFVNDGLMRVTVTEGELSWPLNHIVRHSPDGFSWGYHGSGPAELAHCLLVDYTGAEVEPAVYQQFKADVVAAFPPDDDWVIDSEFIADWLRRDELRRSENERPVTQLDVPDEEVEELKAVVRCEVCDYGPIDATQMVRDQTGAWLCWPCSRGENR